MNVRNIPFKSAALSSAAAITLSAGLVTAPSAQAQTLTPVVDVCTGIRLDESLVVDIVGEVVQPVIGNVEDALDPLGLLDLGLDDTLAAAANGEYISLQVLSSDGTLVDPGESCNLAADGYSLNMPSGIEIGGNAITGLGAEDQGASAGDIDAIAFGNNATTTADAGASVAIGTEANVTVDNSVAIGNGSIASRGPQVDYTAPGLTATFTSAGEFSVGAPGAERQITNVAPGVEATDAATVGQVQGLVDELAADAVLYDDSSHETVTFDGTDGTVLDGVADGALNADSMEAVNGSQLFATNEAVDDLGDRVTVNEGDISDLGDRVTVNEGDISDLGDRVTVNEGDISDLGDRVTVNEGDISDLGDRVTVNETDISNIDDRVTVNETDIANIDDRVTVNEGDIVDLGDRVTVAEGDIDNIDARVSVTENNVTDLDVRVSQNTTTINNLESQVGNVPLAYVEDDDATTRSSTPTNTAALIGADDEPVRVTNVAAGTLSATSTDAVNGAQLNATNQAVAQNTTDIAVNRADIATNRTDIANNRTDIDRNTGDIATINNNLQGSTVVPVQYSNPEAPTVSNGGTITNDVTLIGRNTSAPVRVHNVADAVAGTDAVNLRQVQSGLNAAVASANAYTDGRFNELAFDMRELREASFAGTAGAMAAVGLPQVMDGNGRMIAGAVGHYRGETAFALGISAATNDGRGVFKFNGTVDTHGYAGISTGAGFSF